MAEIFLGNIKGPKGVTFTPSVDSNGNLSWSNDGDLVNPPTVNIKGPKGDQGPAGEGGGGGSGDAIPKTGNRGVLAGYEEAPFLGMDMMAETPAELVINESSPDVSSAFMANIIVDNGAEHGIMNWIAQALFMGNMGDYPNTPCTNWQKVVIINLMSTVTLGSLWRWKGGIVPTIASGLLLLEWSGDYGTACFIDTDDAFNEILEQKAAG